jgi:hypothetical protein
MESSTMTREVPPLSPLAKELLKAAAASLPKPPSPEERERLDKEAERALREALESMQQGKSDPGSRP